MARADLLPVEIPRDRLEPICRRYGVRRLELFGSAARGDRDAAPRDVDLLIDLEPPPGVEYADAYFDLKAALEDLLGMPVELVSLASLRNPFFLEAIAADRRLLYAA